MEQKAFKMSINQTAALDLSAMIHFIMDRKSHNFVDDQLTCLMVVIPMDVLTIINLNLKLYLFTFLIVGVISLTTSNGNRKESELMHIFRTICKYISSA
jgi:hypothetical protein